MKSFRLCCAFVLIFSASVAKAQMSAQYINVGQADSFDKLFRNREINSLKSLRTNGDATVCWEIKHGITPQSCENLNIDALSNPTAAAKLFEVNAVYPCDVFKKGSNEYFRVWVDGESEVSQWFTINPQIPDTLRAFWTPTLMYRFIVPRWL